MPRRWRWIVPYLFLIPGGLWLLLFFVVRNPAYRCNRCGFGARSHHWQCPSCKEWGSIKPLLNYAVV